MAGLLGSSAEPLDDSRAAPMVAWMVVPWVDDWAGQKDGLWDALKADLTADAKAAGWAD